MTPAARPCLPCTLGHHAKHVPRYVVGGVPQDGTVTFEAECPCECVT